MVKKYTPANCPGGAYDPPSEKMPFFHTKPQISQQGYIFMEPNV